MIWMQLSKDWLSHVFCFVHHNLRMTVFQITKSNCWVNKIRSCLLRTGCWMLETLPNSHKDQKQGSTTEETDHCGSSGSGAAESGRLHRGGGSTLVRWRPGDCEAWDGRLPTWSTLIGRVGKQSRWVASTNISLIEADWTVQHYQS